MSRVIVEMDAGLLSEVFRENKELKKINHDKNQRIKELSEKVEFYSKLDCKSDYERGFNRAFEMVLSFLKEVWYAW